MTGSCVTKPVCLTAAVRFTHRVTGKRRCIVDQNGDGGKALELAYQDVRAAFNYFINERNNGRPFIIAGHSQGAFHADRLLKAVAGKALQQRLVAAYPVGFSIDGSNGIDVYTSAEQTVAKFLEHHR